MIFTFFHATKDGEIKPDDQVLIAAAVESVRAAHPGAGVVMLSDERTVFEASLGIDEVVRRPVAFEEIMFERMAAQAAFVDGLADGERVAFLDTDVLVVRPVTFMRSFDVGVTVRPPAEIGFRLIAGAPPMPFQGGVLFACGGVPARSFFHKAVETYERIDRSPRLRAVHPDGVKGWYGDQYVLSAMLGPYVVDGLPSQVVHDGAVVSFLPCDRYNHSFAPGQKIRTWDLLERKIVHFKGNSKKLMPALADAVHQLKQITADYMAALEREQAAEGRG